MRHDPEFAQPLHEVLRVVSLVGAQRRPRCQAALGHGQRRIPLRPPVRRRELDVDDEPVAVLRHHMPDVARARRLPAPLPVQVRVGIGRADVGVPVPALAAEVNVRVSARRLVPVLLVA